MALATVVSQTVSAIASFWAANRTLPLFRYQSGLPEAGPGAAAPMCPVGRALTGQNMLIALFYLGLAGGGQRFRPVMVTAYTTVESWTRSSSKPYSSMATALGTYTGQNVGAGKDKRVAGPAGSCPHQFGLYAADVWLVLFGGSRCWVFSCGIRRVIHTALMGGCGSTAIFGFLGLLYAVRGVLNGAGDAVYSAINGVIELVCRLAFAFVADPQNRPPWAASCAAELPGSWRVWFPSGAMPSGNGKQKQNKK